MLETTTLLLIAVGITNGADIPANLTEEDLAKDN